MWAFFFFRQCCRNAESLELRQWTRAGKRPFYYYYKQKRGWNTKVFRHILKCNRNSTVISQFYNCKSNPYEINGWFNPGYFTKVEDTALNRTILMFVKIFTKMEILVSQKLLPPPHSTQTTIFSTKKERKSCQFLYFFTPRAAADFLLPDYSDGSRIWPNVPIFINLYWLMKLIYVNWLIRQTSSNTLCIKTKVENFRRGPGFLRSRIGTAMNIVSSDMRDVRDTDCCLPEQKRIPSIQENLFCELLKTVCYHHHYPGWLSNMFLGISFSKFYDPLLFPQLCSARMTLGTT